MSAYGCPTTRVHPRTMAGVSAAWPQSPEYAQAINAPEPTLIGPIDTRPTAGEALLWAVAAVATVAVSALVPWAGGL